MSVAQGGTGVSDFPTEYARIKRDVDGKVVWEDSAFQSVSLPYDGWTSFDHIIDIEPNIKAHFLIINFPGTWGYYSSSDSWVSLSLNDGTIPLGSFRSGTGHPSASPIYLSNIGDITIKNLRMTGYEYCVAQGYCTFTKPKIV